MSKPKKTDEEDRLQALMEEAQQAAESLRSFVATSTEEVEKLKATLAETLTVNAERLAAAGEQAAAVGAQLAEALEESKQTSAQYMNMRAIHDRALGLLEAAEERCAAVGVEPETVPQPKNRKGATPISPRGGGSRSFTSGRGGGSRSFSGDRSPEDPSKKEEATEA
jgi:hypothetical protein